MIKYIIYFVLLVFQMIIALRLMVVYFLMMTTDRQAGFYLGLRMAGAVSFYDLKSSSHSFKRMLFVD